MSNLPWPERRRAVEARLDAELRAGHDLKFQLILEKLADDLRAALARVDELEAALQSARAEALEEAARAVDERAGGFDQTVSARVQDCAEAVRRLKEGAGG